MDGPQREELLRQRVTFADAAALIGRRLAEAREALPEEGDVWDVEGMALKLAAVRRWLRACDAALHGGGPASAVAEAAEHINTVAFRDCPPRAGGGRLAWRR